MNDLQYTRKWKKNDLIVRIGNTAVGDGHFLMAAGPCAVESDHQMNQVVHILENTPVKLLRGGAFKPRTSPYSFRGLGEEGLVLLRQTADALHIPFVTEVTDIRHLDIVSEYADALQIGSRNMSSYELLTEIGQQGKPVILKRGMAATLKEFLYALEYVVRGGNEQVILCERGIRSFDESFRNIVDLNAVAMLKQVTPFPVIVDPSHGSGRSDIVIPLSLAATAAGADGVMVETHPEPENALSDGSQSLASDIFPEWSARVSDMARYMGKRL